MYMSVDWGRSLSGILTNVNCAVGVCDRVFSPYVISHTQMCMYSLSLCPFRRSNPLTQRFLVGE